MKVKDIMHLDPETVIVFKDYRTGNSLGVNAISFDEGIYNSDEDLYELLSENDIVDLENRHLQGEDALEFVSLVILS